MYYYLLYLLKGLQTDDETTTLSETTSHSGDIVINDKLTSAQYS